MASNLNPADILSGGCDTKSVPTSWSVGLDFLRDYKNNWPSTRPEEALSFIEGVEIIQTVMVASVVTDSEISQHSIEKLIQHFPSFYTLKKALSWILRVKKFLRSGKDEATLSDPVTAEELSEAERQIGQVVQRQTYMVEIASLQHSGSVPKPSQLKQLCPVLNRNGRLL